MLNPHSPSASNQTVSQLLTPSVQIFLNGVIEDQDFKPQQGFLQTKHRNIIQYPSQINENDLSNYDLFCGTRGHRNDLLAFRKIFLVPKDGLRFNLRKGEFTGEDTRSGSSKIYHLLLVPKAQTMNWTMATSGGGSCVASHGSVLSAPFAITYDRKPTGLNRDDDAASVASSSSVGSLSSPSVISTPSPLSSSGLVSYNYYTPSPTAGIPTQFSPSMMMMPTTTNQQQPQFGVLGTNNVQQQPQLTTHMMMPVPMSMYQHQQQSLLPNVGTPTMTMMENHSQQQPTTVHRLNGMNSPQVTFQGFNTPMQPTSFESQSSLPSTHGTPSKNTGVPQQKASPHTPPRTPPSRELVTPPILTSSPSLESTPGVNSSSKQTTQLYFDAPSELRATFASTSTAAEPSMYLEACRLPNYDTYAFALNDQARLPSTYEHLINNTKLGKQLTITNQQHLVKGLFTVESEQFKDSLFIEQKYPLVMQVSENGEQILLPKDCKMCFERSSNRISRIFRDMSLCSCLLFVSFFNLRNFEKEERKKSELEESDEKEKLKKFCIDGIKLENGRTYTFFATSNSGISGNTALFIDCTCLNIPHVFKLLGDFSESMKSGDRKFNGRVGLNIGTSVKSNIQLEQGQYYVSTTDDKEYPGVDGINAIEEEFFKSILKCLTSEGVILMDQEEIENTTSFQGRVLGIKGMFQMIPTKVWNELFVKKHRLNPNVKVYIRASTVKFAAESRIYNYFDVLNVSSPKSIGNISRNTIKFLCRKSTKPQEIEKYFLENYKQYLNELCQGALDREYLLKRIFIDDDSDYGYETKIVRAALENGETFETNPFLIDKIKQKIINERMIRLGKKLQGQIKYPDLLNLKGVIDESEFLQDDEVLIASSKFKATPYVVVFRNPIAHANDFLKLKVVSAPIENEFLNRVRESIVFPKLKGKKGPHQFLSSGDLDGDLYSILTDPNLIKLLDKPFNRMDYEQLAKDYVKPSQKPKPVTDVGESRKDQARFFIEYTPKIGLFYTALTNDLYLNNLSENDRKKYALFFSLSIDAVKHGSVILQDPKSYDSLDFMDLFTDDMLESDVIFDEQILTKIKPFEQELIRMIYGSIQLLKNKFSDSHKVDSRYSIDVDIRDSNELKEAFIEWEKINRDSRSERRDLLSQVYGKKQHKQWLKSKMTRVANYILPGTLDTTPSLAVRIHSTYFRDNELNTNVEKATTWLNQAIAHPDEKMRKKMVRFVYLVCYKWLSIRRIQQGNFLSFGVCKYSNQ
ncbi:hypothetical protein C9374_005270 [Naegleria lovaniensis]|uniref:RNA-dependent RNA polymerase n=1 Tax=Naegleria lovaniensis TaxID=51637 RepID=A0AA88GLZ9_NAELO|nr:uncharacterized protein C9374_005270 [Naegleria lovaniensis]KAG2382690.1 hypothetical protein C9374_005270 [Naegleria lovaniensis]